MERVIAYVDGFNLYFGLRTKGWRRYYWLNIRALAQNLLRRDQQLVLTKYFTSRVSLPEDKRRRQSAFLAALETLEEFEIYYGKYLFSERTCHACGHRYSLASEKMSDVNIAVHLLLDAFDDRFDTALLISADSDLVPAVRAVTERPPYKRVVVAFPPERSSLSLKRYASAWLAIGRTMFARSVFPPEVSAPSGLVFHRPESWR